MDIQFPPILVINLEHRTDRWAEIQENFKKEGWPILNRIDAVKCDPGWYGATQSHAKCIYIAKQNNLPWVLVLEDDCFPREGAFQRFCELLPSLWQRRNEWDIFIGGLTTPRINSIVQKSPILFNADGLTTHFMLMNENSYDKILNDITKEPLFIDNYYRNNPSIRMFCTLPQLAVQTPSASDITNTFANYTESFLDSDNKLTEFLKEHEESCKS
jgi:GR25 family glycosyltransferase involved in LPS biosynthesis